MVRKLGICYLLILSLIIYCTRDDSALSEEWIDFQSDG